VKPAVYHRRAQAELDKAIAYYEKQQRGLGLELEEEVYAAIRIVRENPQIGAPYGRSKQRYYLVRRFPYIIFYEELDEAVGILAIAHGSRRPGYWRRRKLR
jgi:toxin ParE1/3/4